MDILGFNLVDLIVIAVVLLSGIFALARGLVREVLAIASWVGAAFATFYGFSYVSPYAHSLIGEPMIADIVTAAAIFLIVLFVLSLISGAIAGAVRGTAAGSVDRTLGFVFGLVRGAVLVSLAYLAFSYAFPPADQPSWLRAAKTIPLMQHGATMLVSLAPAKMRPEVPEERRAATPADATEQPAAAATPPAGYRTDDRRDMERLIQGAQ